MTESKLKWKQRVYEALLTMADKSGLSRESIPFDSLVGEFPPKPEMGDIGFPLFGYSKLFRKAPAALASEAAGILMAGIDPGEGRVIALGPYLNIFLDRSSAGGTVLKRGSGLPWIDPVAKQGEKIMVEFSCPNTNKPLHLGHLRNNVIGESLSRILKAAGAEVLKVNLINDRGVHICKSMLAYQVYGGGRTPADEGLKSDHFVGKYYVKFNELKAADPQAEEKAQDLLRRWEAGDPEVLSLWKSMNAWAVEGIKTTYARQGIGFDRYYYEHETYMKGVSEVMKGLDKGIFYQEADGSIWVNLEDIGLDRKVLLRKDGTSLYITQDIGTAIYRHNEWPFERLVYVVASEQQYHFKVLFEVLKRLGYDWAARLFHLAYGLVNLPSGRMKTREGTVVDADDLIDELSTLARAGIVEKGRDSSVGNLDSVAGKVALGALHYYLLQTSPTKDMLYDPEQSLSFTGNTGPYIQYMGARACSILRKWEAQAEAEKEGEASAKALSGEADWTLVRRLAAFPENLEHAARTLEPSIMAAYAHEVASDFSTWYRDNPVLNCPDQDLSASRVVLVKAVKATLEGLCNLLCIPFLEAM
ncbi:MAG: arginine--tRNA ligase [Spirochaetes bacterium]|nr:arginine--tRNA ligase [Spirochaetota bacterium]